MLTSIQITKDVKEELNSMKKSGESYEDVITRLIEESKKPKMKPKQEPEKNVKQLKPVRLIG